MTEAVRRRPYAVVLLDEIEKAHPEVFNILLQVLDDGRLTDNKGRTVSFKNAILIMTSNIAAEYIQQESANLGEFNRDVIYENMRKTVLETLRRTLRPEFLNRIDETIVFSALTLDEIKDIVRLQLKHLELLLVDKNIALAVSDDAVGCIAETAFDSSFGARPIKRFINKELTQRVAQMLLSGAVKPGQTLEVDRGKSGELALTAANDSPRAETVEK